MKAIRHHAHAEQGILFQPEHVLLNGALQDLRALRLEKAHDGFDAYRNFYPNGDDVTDHLRLIDFLQDGLNDLPGGRSGAVALNLLWRALTDFVAPLRFLDEALLGAVRRSLFLKAAALLGTEHITVPFLSDETPAGYIYLQAGQWDTAIVTLQAALLRLPQNGHIYGYLGDAYTLRGDPTAARSCYLEAFLIDPAAVDWRTFQDGDLLMLKQRLQTEEGMDPFAASHWLASYAYCVGLFRPKEIRQLEVMRTFVASYLDLERTYMREAIAVRGANLFLRAIVLCDNEAFLRMVKGIDYVDIRRRMKEISEPLFAAYIKRIGDRSRPRSEQRRH